MIDDLEINVGTFEEDLQQVNPVPLDCLHDMNVSILPDF